MEAIGRDCVLATVDLTRELCIAHDVRYADFVVYLVVAEVFQSEVLQSEVAYDPLPIRSAEIEVVVPSFAAYKPGLTRKAAVGLKGEQRSCVAAVARVVVLLLALGHKPCSGNTGAY